MVMGFDNDTIFAISSGIVAQAGVAVVRLSGPDADVVAQELFAEGVQLPRDRVATVRYLHDPVSGDLLDQALVIRFPHPNSFTGEDVVELHLHGSRAVVSAVIRALSRTRARPATRGEFTRRAFENGRMDLTEVEGLGDLIAADTDEQRKQALRQLRGDVRRAFESWREEVKQCLAHAEAVIDFGDDVDEEVFEAVVPRVESLAQDIERRSADNRRGEIVRDGLAVAIVGPPNAGKSTLLNILAGRSAAIVSARPGTTRDIVEVNLDIDGVPVLVRDTAGLRDSTDDDIEIEGMRRAREAARSADIAIIVVDASTAAVSESASPHLSDKATQLLTDLTASDRDTNTQAPEVLIVENKKDLITHDLHDPCDTSRRTVPRFRTSLTSGDGFDALMEQLRSTVRTRVERGSNSDASDDASANETPIITRARHRHHVENTVQALRAFVDGRADANPARRLPMDLATEELRIASRELGAVTGTIHVEEVLDTVFSEFCIGK